MEREACTKTAFGRYRKSHCSRNHLIHQKYACINPLYKNVCINPLYIKNKYKVLFSENVH